METGALAAWLKKPGEAVERGEVIAEVETPKGLVKAEALTSGVIERLLVRIGEKVPAGTAIAIIRAQGQSAGKEGSLAQQEEQKRRELREAALKRKEELEALRQEARQSLDASSTQEQEEKKKLREAEEKLHAEREAKERDPELMARRKLERERMAKRQAELAKLANITMQQAIQIAMSQQSGTVMECRLIGERPAGERDQVFYILTIVSGDEQESASTRMLISAVDGRVVKTWKDEK
jgi:pyruvate dehydrogenase E2 component (dihydrolipoamide acetyltransferase)